MKRIIEPLAVINKKTAFILIAIEAVVAIALWHYAGNGLIPSPVKVMASVMRILSSWEFYENLFSSLSLTLKGMGISILLALTISYISLIPLFTPISKFIIKCRYLTLTGLIFLFTLITKDGHDLKISLLIFGIVPFFVTSLLSVVESINSQEYELCRTLRMNNWQTLYEVVILGRLDQVLEVMRQNFAIAWMMITMVEGISMSEGGLGAMLIKSNKYIDLGTVFAILVIIFTIGIFFDFLLGQLRFWLFPYAKLQIRK